MIEKNPKIGIWLHFNAICVICVSCIFCGIARHLVNLFYCRTVHYLMYNINRIVLWITLYLLTHLRQNMASQ